MRKTSNSIDTGVPALAGEPTSGAVVTGQVQPAPVVEEPQAGGSYTRCPETSALIRNTTEVVDADAVPKSE